MFRDPATALHHCRRRVRLLFPATNNLCGPPASFGVTGLAEGPPRATARPDGALLHLPRGPKAACRSPCERCRHGVLIFCLSEPSRHRSCHSRKCRPACPASSGWARSGASYASWDRAPSWLAAVGAATQGRRERNEAAARRQEMAPASLAPKLCSQVRVKHGGSDVAAH